MHLETSGDQEIEELLPTLNPKRKIGEKMLDKLKIGEDGELIYDGYWKVIVGENIPVRAEHDGQEMKNCDVS